MEKLLKNIPLSTDFDLEYVRRDLVDILGEINTESPSIEDLINKLADNDEHVPSSKLVKEILKRIPADLRALNKTIFQVYPTLVDIPAGTVYEEDSTLTYLSAVPQNAVLSFTVGNVNADRMFIDIGDGTIRPISEFKRAAGENELLTFDIDYSNILLDDSIPCDKQTEYGKKYTVTIYGNEYKTFSTYGVDSSKNVIICDILTYNKYPIASNVTRHMLCQSKRLVKLTDIYAYEATNMKFEFMECPNLQTITSYDGFFNKAIVDYTQMFWESNNITSFDFCFYRTSLLEEKARKTDILPRIPKVVFDDSFNGYLDNLLPKNTRLNGYVGNYYVTATVKQKFSANMKIKDIDFAAWQLWKNPNITFTNNTSELFSKLSDELRAKIPTSWGGTMEG